MDGLFVAKPILFRAIFSRRPWLNAMGTSILLWNTNNIIWIQGQGDAHTQF